MLTRNRIDWPIYVEIDTIIIGFIHFHETQFVYMYSRIWTLNLYVIQKKLFIISIAFSYLLRSETVERFEAEWDSVKVYI